MGRWMVPATGAWKWAVHPTRPSPHIGVRSFVRELCGGGTRGRGSGPLCCLAVGFHRDSMGGPRMPAPVGHPTHKAAPAGRLQKDGQPHISQMQPADHSFATPARSCFAIAPKSRWSKVYLKR